MKHKPFEQKIAERISRRLARRERERPLPFTIEMGHYCHGNPRALVFYLKKALKVLSVRFGEIHLRQLNEDVCWTRCFKGFPVGGSLPQCRYCVAVRLETGGRPVSGKEIFHARPSE